MSACRACCSPTSRSATRRGARATRLRRRRPSTLLCSVLEQAPAARTTVQSPLAWSGNPDWKLDYCNIERLTADEISARRAEFDKAKDVAKAVREATG